MSRVNRILHPPSWPIAAKVTVTLLYTALIPMMLTAYYNLQGSLKSVSDSELRNMEQVAVITASRIDQIIKDTRLVNTYLSSEPELGKLLTKTDAARRTAVEARLQSLLSVTDAYELIMVLDNNGVVRASSSSKFLGQNFGFRDYFKEAIQGRHYVSDMVVGKISRKPGLFYSAPVLNDKGTVSGVAVIKMRGSVFFDLMEDITTRGKLKPVLLDGDGVIIYHPDPALLYHSLFPLRPEVLQDIIGEQRFMTDEVKSLGYPDAIKALIDSRSPGFVSYVSPLTSEEMIAGYAPLSGHNWTVVMTATHATFKEPLTEMFDNVVKSVVVVGLVFIIISLFFSRSFVRPLRRLIDAAHHIGNGDYRAGKVKVSSQDEIGKLTDTFNMMVDGIQERERIKDVFGRVVSPEVREMLTAGEITLGGEYRRVAVLFSDIRGFSGICEQLSAQDVVSFLNEYMTEMAEAVRPWGGYINNFIGDAIVVIFGAPTHQKDIEWRAVAAALTMRDRLKMLNLRRKEIGDPPIKSGIGVATGKVVSGQIGSLERFLYTVIGDSVNVASRLESMVKEYPQYDILINGDTYEQVRDRTDIEIVSLGQKSVKGRTGLVDVYAVTGLSTPILTPVPIPTPAPDGQE